MRCHLAIVKLVGCNSPRLVPNTGRSSVQSFKITKDRKLVPVLRFKHPMISIGHHMDLEHGIIVSQYIKHLTGSSERKEMIASSWEGHIVRLVELSENTRF